MPWQHTRRARGVARTAIMTTRSPPPSWQAPRGLSSCSRSGAISHLARPRAGGPPPTSTSPPPSSHSAPAPHTRPRRTVHLPPASTSPPKPEPHSNGFGAASRGTTGTEATHRGPADGGCPRSLTGLGRAGGRTPPGPCLPAAPGLRRQRRPAHGRVVTDAPPPRAPFTLGPHLSAPPLLLAQTSRLPLHRPLPLVAHVIARSLASPPTSYAPALLPTHILEPPVRLVAKPATARRPGPPCALWS